MPGPESDENGKVSHNSAAWKPHLYHGDPNGVVWSPAMVDTVLRNHHWFWKPDTETTIESVDRLVSFYYQSVGRNANLVLGLTPDPQGLLPEPDCERCEEFGAEIRRRFARVVAKTKGTGRSVTLDLPKPASIAQVVIMEDIAHGERVREYVLEGRVSGDTWQTLATGSCIGHKRIERIEPTEVAAVRLRVTQSQATPLIRKLAAYL
jgi:alpha-L-fucosidase